MQPTSQASPRVKGRPPAQASPRLPPLGEHSRAMLARLISDCPPRGGYSGKMRLAADDEPPHFEAVYPHVNVGRVRAHGAAMEVKEREIRRLVKKGEKEALTCLRGILAKTLKRVDVAESRLALENDTSTEAPEPSRRGSVKGSSGRGSKAGSRPGSSSTTRSGRRKLSVLPGDPGGAPLGKALSTVASEEGGNGSEHSSPDQDSVADASHRSSSRPPDFDPAKLGQAWELPVTSAPIDREDGLPQSRRVRALLANREDVEFAAVSMKEAVQLVQRVHFFRELDIVREVLVEVVSWFETQCFDVDACITTEGHGCNTFCILAAGVAEARERGPNGQVSRPLHRGSYWGDAALLADGQRALPHLCSVVALEPCVVLVLRRQKLASSFRKLPQVIRTEWLMQAERHRQLHANTAVQWRVREMTRIRALRMLPSPLLVLLDAISTYKVLARGTILQQQGQPLDGLHILLHGEAGLFESRDGPPRLVRCWTERSSFPVIGADAYISSSRPTALQTAATHARCSQVMLVPLRELRRHTELAQALRYLFDRELQIPQGLAARLAP